MKRQRTLSDHHQRKCLRENVFPESLVSSLEWNFDKRFTYGTVEDSQRPMQTSDLFSHDSWYIDDLLAIKERLNAVKSELSDKDIRTWHSHTCNRNPGGLIVSRVREAAKPELCTQAWCKFHEILATFRLVEDFADGEDSKLRTLHLCEAPGAFVVSLNHYMRSRGMLCDWDWTANTLNPHYEGNDTDHMIADDKFIMQTQSQWNFGPDNTGNIMSTENLRSLQEKYRASKCHLVTADGSIDCADNPGEQESMTSRLHYCELVTALCALAVRGHLVIKMFTLLEHPAICMMYLMYSMFDKVTVCKPVSSKPGNSEVYVVCHGFKGVSEEVLEKLLSNTEYLTKSLLPKTVIPESFRKQHLSCCQMFAEYQIETIRRNQATFSGEAKDKTSDSDVRTDEEVLEMQKECCAQIYMEKCKIQSIQWSEKMMVNKRKQIHKNHSSREPSEHVRKQAGTFTHRQEVRHLSWQQRVCEMKQFEVDCMTKPFTLKKCWSLSEDCPEWTVVTGKRLECVKSSVFCSDRLLSLYNTFLQHQERNNLQKTSPETCDDKISELLQKRFAKSHTSPNLEIVGSVCPFMEALKKILEMKGINVTLNETNNQAESSRLHVVLYEQAVDEAVLPVDQRTFGRCLQVLLEELHRGGCLLLQIAVPLTRLYTGLMYVLHSLFQKVLVITPSESTGLPSVYVFCEHFIYNKTELELLPSNSSPCLESQCVTFAHQSECSESENTCKPEQVSRSCDRGSERNRCVTDKNWRKSSMKRDEWSDLIGYLKDVYSQWVLLVEDGYENEVQLLEFVPMSHLYETDFFDNLCWMNNNLLKQRMNSFMSQYH